MKSWLTLFTMLSIAWPASALELGQRVPAKRDPVVVPNVRLPRQGGDTIADALPIPEIPFADDGTTAGYTDDYDEACPYPGSTSPDVVYVYTAVHDDVVRIDLCGSSYDTKVYVYDEALTVLACNDDYYYDDVCGVYVSRIDIVDLPAGGTYYIVVDGYGGDFGDYQLAVTDTWECWLECPPYGVPEGEPPLANDQLDMFNCGCGCEPGGNFATELVGDADGELYFCGKSGWYTYQGLDLRESDWLTAVVGAGGMVTIDIDGEWEISLFRLLPLDCNSVTVAASVIAGPCVPVQMTITEATGTLLWLWVGPTAFTPPYGPTPYEFDYYLDVAGLAAPVGVAAATWSAVKSLYR